MHDSQCTIRGFEGEPIMGMLGGKGRGWRRLVAALPP